VVNLPEAQLGPAERLLDLVLNSSAHLWHNRPGLDVGGVWAPRKSGGGRRGRAAQGVPVAPGLFVPAAQVLYSKLCDLYLLNATLMAHFAGYVLDKTEWRDLKVACAALMLVQPRAGQPIHEPDGSVALYEDDYRAIGEVMMLRYEKQSTRMLTPRGCTSSTASRASPIQRRRARPSVVGPRPPPAGSRSASRTRRCCMGS
jgi:hypothetical protein